MAKKLKYTYYEEDGHYIVEVPELLGKIVDAGFMDSYYEICGYPSFSEKDLTEDEIEEYMEEWECDREKAIESLIYNLDEEACEEAPSLIVDVITNELADCDGQSNPDGFHHFDIVVEEGFDGARSGVDYMCLGEKEIAKIMKEIFMQLDE